jgi:hypothetical protein
MDISKFDDKKNEFKEFSDEMNQRYLFIMHERLREVYGIKRDSLNSACAAIYSVLSITLSVLCYVVEMAEEEKREKVLDTLLKSFTNDLLSNRDNILKEIEND